MREDAKCDERSNTSVRFKINESATHIKYRRQSATMAQRLSQSPKEEPNKSTL